MWGNAINASKHNKVAQAAHAKLCLHTCAGPSVPNCGTNRNSGNNYWNLPSLYGGHARLSLGEIVAYPSEPYPGRKSCHLQRNHTSRTTSTPRHPGTLSPLLAFVPPLFARILHTCPYTVYLMRVINHSDVHRQVTACIRTSSLRLSMFTI